MISIILLAVAVLMGACIVLAMMACINEVKKLVD